MYIKVTLPSGKEHFYHFTGSLCAKKITDILSTCSKTDYTIYATPSTYNHDWEIKSSGPNAKIAFISRAEYVIAVEQAIDYRIEEARRFE